MIRDPLMLLRGIEASFGASVYPGDEHIVRDESELESEKIRDQLKGKHWRDVPFETLERLARSLPFLSAEGYRYYLPAFMVISVVDFARAGIISDEIVRSLTVPQASDVDRIRELATQHPEVHPFTADEWKDLLGEMEASHGSSGPIEAVFFERASGFDPSQANLIREFLEYLRDVHGGDFPEREPERALERYWSTR